MDAIFNSEELTNCVIKGDLEGLRSFLNHFRHDLMGPLSSAHLQVQLSLRKEESAENKKSLERILKNLREVEDMISRTLGEKPQGRFKSDKM